MKVNGDLTSLFELWFVIDYFQHFSICTDDDHVQCSQIKYEILVADHFSRGCLCPVACLNSMFAV